MMGDEGAGVMAILMDVTIFSLVVVAVEIPGEGVEILLLGGKAERFSVKVSVPICSSWMET